MHLSRIFVGERQTQLASSGLGRRAAESRERTCRSLELQSSGLLESRLSRFCRSIVNSQRERLLGKQVLAHAMDTIDARPSTVLDFSYDKRTTAEVRKTLYLISVRTP